MKKKAKIYRMVTPDHLCPWGIKALDLLRRGGFEIEDHHLESAEKNAAFKEEHGVGETPQVWIGGERVGGYDALRERLGKKPEGSEGETYQPVIAIFAATFLMALAACWAEAGALTVIRAAELFVAFSMVVLAIMKWRDLAAFSTGFVQYDIVARRYVPYAYIYPFIEGGAGIAMIAGLATWVAAPLALIASTIGAISVFKAVYVEGRNLNCACVGGGSQVPLGAISLTENIMMMVMALWMMAKALHAAPAAW